MSGRGTGRVNAKITAEQVAQIMDRRERLGHSVARIARDMRLPKSTVGGVVYSGNGVRTVGK